MPSRPPALQTFFQEPLSSSLLLSLSLHLALLALVQPMSGEGVAETFVINARLESVAAPTTPPQKHREAIAPPPEPAPQLQPANDQVQDAAPPPSLLTSSVPSPAPSLPVAPTPPEPAPEQPRPAADIPAAAAIAMPIASSPSGQVANSPVPVINAANASLGLDVDPTWYIARQVDVHARAVGSIVPEYPEQARRRNQEGTLKLMLKIDDLGRVHDAEVVEADPPGIFDKAALEAFGKARFQPAMKDGRPVRYQAYIRVVFKLRD